MDLPLDDTLLALLEADAAAEQDHSPPSPAATPAPLSFAQQRLWYLHQFAPRGTAYNLPRALRLRGELAIETLAAALQQVIERHDGLRSAFCEIDGEPVQCVDTQAQVPLEYEDLSALPPAARDTALRAAIEAQAGWVFDLARPPLLAARLVKLAECDHVLLLTLHHIVSDAWSNPILLRDLIAAYTNIRRGAPAAPRPARQYADFARWQRREYVHSAACAQAAAYWRDYLGDDLEPLQLPRDTLPVLSPRALRHAFALNAELASQLESCCRRENQTPFVIALGAWQLLLSRYSGQRRFGVGVPVAGRNRGDTQDMVGFFVNTQIYKADIDTQLSARDFLQQLRRQSVLALGHGDYPIELYLESLRNSGGKAPAALFQALFNWRVGQGAALPPFGTLAIDFLPVGVPEPKCDLSLDIDYTPAAIECVLEYDGRYFSASTIERLAAYWQQLLAAIVRDPQQRLGELPMLENAERAAILRDWNGTRACYPQRDCLHTRIEAQVARAPDAVALIAGDERWTYAQLNARANRLAHALIERGVGADVRVGIAVERSPDMVIGLLAILKAGGAYVPLDPSYPEQRLRYLLGDSGVNLLLTHSAAPALVVSPQLRVLYLDQADLYAERADNPPPRAFADNLAYVIYTSGSTGDPKGALLPHHNVLRLFDATAGHFRFGSGDTWTLFHSYAFDFSVWEIFGALLYGGRLVIVPHAISRAPEAFYALLCRERVTVLNQTPSAFKPLIPVACAPSQAQHQLRYVIFGGEALDVNSLRPWFERFGDGRTRLVNMYGITETTVHVTYRALSRADLDGDCASPIGERIADLDWYLLDGDFNVIPRGAAGELLIGGAGLARGYHGRPALTALRFVPDPFGEVGGRLYRSGDLARYRADGAIEYLGRIDQQVKIRGFRIELGEIEARLREHPDTGEVVVLAHAGAGGQQLVAYIVPRAALLMRAGIDAQRALVEMLKPFLKSRVPDYMVPAHWVLLEQLPLTANGKLDRRALPPPESGALQAAYVAPRGEREQQLAAIWRELLRVERVGRDDQFFELGGDSILAMQLLATLRGRFDSRIGLQDLLAHPTLAALAFCIDGSPDAAPANDCIVALNQSRSAAPPLFCIHPSGGMVFSYQPLAKKLQPQARVYGVLHRAGESVLSAQKTWRDMIDSYSRRIVATQPEGPYRLLGWSLGGSIAWDIAARLEAEGREVSFLGLVDSTIPEALYPPDMPRRARRVSAGVPDTARELQDTLALFQLLFPRLGDAAEQFVRANPDAGLDDFYTWAQARVGTGPDPVYALLENARAEIAHSESFAVAERLEAAFAAFVFSPLRVRPSCWWSMPHKTPEHIACAEAIVRSFSRSGELNCSLHAPFPHETMVLHEAMIDSFIEELLRTPR